jgi:hypothetical protein
LAWQTIEITRYPEVEENHAGLRRLPGGGRSPAKPVSAACDRLGNRKKPTASALFSLFKAPGWPITAHKYNFFNWLGLVRRARASGLYVNLWRANLKIHSLFRAPSPIALPCSCSRQFRPESHRDMDASHASGNFSRWAVPLSPAETQIIRGIVCKLRRFQNSYQKIHN